MIKRMFDSVVDVLGLLRPVVAELDVEGLDPEAAAELVELLVEVEQLAAAGRVYRGRKNRSLMGAYIFADAGGTVWAARAAGGKAVEILAIGKAPSGSEALWVDSRHRERARGPFGGNDVLSARIAVR